MTFCFLHPILLSSLPFCDGGLTYYVVSSSSWPAVCTDIAIDTLPVQGSVAELSSEVARAVCVELGISEFWHSNRRTNLFGLHIPFIQ